ncbi:hypothetical protein NQL31_008169 [Lotmaria passim]
MHTERDDALLRKKLNVSAAWSADLTPIRSPTPRQMPGSTASQPYKLSSPFSFRTPSADAARSADDLRQPQSWSSKRVAPSAFPYPHLVRSRSPHGHAPPSPSPNLNAPPSLNGNAELHAETTALDDAADATHSRVDDTFADVLSREWPFQPLPSDTADFADAVRCGQVSALVHYANSGFRAVSSRLAQEAGAVSMEADRCRAAARNTVIECRSAAAAYREVKAELAAAQQRLKALMDEKAQEEKSLDPKADATHSTSSAATDASLGALTIKLDEELAKMRDQKRRYEMLCSQKARWEAQVENWTFKEKKLEVKLEREQVRRGNELGNAVRGFHARPSLPVKAAHESQTAQMKAWLRDFEVCIMERRELLHHLQEGSKNRFERFKSLLHRSYARGVVARNKDQGALYVGTARREDVSADQTESLQLPHQPSQENLECKSESEVASTKLLNYLYKVHRTVSLSEEEALTEMEHLRVLFYRLQRQEASKVGAERRTSLPS